MNLKRHIQRYHISKLAEYEKALTKGKMKSSADENPGAPKQTKINKMMMSSLSRKVTQIGVNDRIYELIVNSISPWFRTRTLLNTCNTWSLL